jgi:hypothetical protein
MSTNTENQRTINIDLPSARILLAESDPLEMARIRLNIDLEFRDRVKVIKTYNELITNIAKEIPQLLMLGRIDKLNYFEVCQECHRLWPKMPIILLSRQEVINYSFYQVVKSYGVTDIVSNNFEKVNQLLQALDLFEKTIEGKLVDKQSSGSVTTGKMILAGLEEIVVISNNYFGALAQGNYWRKSHARAVDEFPFIQKWSADHFGKLSCDDSILEQALTDEDIRGLRVWVDYFIGECERIIVDYKTLLNNSALSPLAKDLLNKPS